MAEIKIRRAVPGDFEELYALGMATPEFSVSSELPFMGPYEFKFTIVNPEGFFFVAEKDGAIAGFVYGDLEGEKRFDNKTWACLVYIMVKPEFQGKGLAQKLYDTFYKEVKDRGATHLYSWANAEEGSRVIPFFEKQGLKPGHLYRWMDKSLD